MSVLQLLSFEDCVEKFIDGYRNLTRIIMAIEDVLFRKYRLEINEKILE